MTIMPYVKNSLDQKILASVRREPRSRPFTARRFTHLGKNDAVRKALSRLACRSKIRRIRRGLYDIPRKHRLLGELSPDPMEVAQAVMESSKARQQASGAYAANLLGLSEQIPAKVVILTDGLARTILLGKQQVVFRRTSPRNLIGAGSLAGMVFQALRHFGKDGVEERHVSHLQRHLDAKTKNDLKSMMPDMPVWMQPIIEKIAEERK